MPYDEQQPCTIELALRNTAGTPLQIVRLSGLSNESKLLKQYELPVCRLRAESDWQPCVDIDLPRDEALRVRIGVTFDDCERRMDVGAITSNSEHQEVTIRRLGIESTVPVPWNVWTGVAYPSAQKCPARFPAEKSRQQLAVWLAEELDANGTTARIAAEDITFLGLLDGTDYGLRTHGETNDRLGEYVALFVVERGDETCLGLAGYDRTLASAPVSSRIDLDDWRESERLVSHAVRCPSEGEGTEGGAHAVFVPVDSMRLDNRALVGGVTSDDRIRQVSWETPPRPVDAMASVRDGVFLHAVRQDIGADPATVRLYLWRHDPLEVVGHQTIPITVIEPVVSRPPMGRYWPITPEHPIGRTWPHPTP
jgi:hypothetical protein